MSIFRLCALISCMLVSEGVVSSQARQGDEGERGGGRGTVPRQASRARPWRAPSWCTPSNPPAAAAATRMSG